ncbi:MAG: MFS transporter, partial [Acidimicrobiales bacterium]
MTMVALCFANGLQGGASQAFAQTTEALKHTFHVNDAAIGAVPFGVAIAGNVGAVPVAALCARHKRTAVLAGMFVLWGILMALSGVAPVFSVFGVAAAGFVVFAIFRTLSALLEATDPATLPLIADWWPVEDRARRVSVFNTFAGIGTFAGLIAAGVMVDKVGWRWAFIVWMPFAWIGALLIRSRVEPPRGGQDAAYGDRLEALAGEDRDLVATIVEQPAVSDPDLDTPPPLDRWAVVREIVRLRSWRYVAVGLAVSGIMGNAMMNWGLAYFKRTFGLTGTQAAELAPLLGVGAFVGLLGGGYLADRLLARGMLRARMYVAG